MSSVFFQEINKIDMHVYFLVKVFKGAEARYQKIEKMALAIIVAVRKLRPYFQGYKIFVNTNYHILQLLKKSYLEGRMVSLAMELSEYDI